MARPGQRPIVTSVPLSWASKPCGVTATASSDMPAGTPGTSCADGGQAAGQGAGRSVEERRTAEVDGLRFDQQLATVGDHRAGRLQGDVATEDGDLALDARLAVAGVVDGDVLADLLGHGGERDRGVDVERLRPQTGLGEPHTGAGRHDVDEVALGRHDVLAAQLDGAEPGLVGREVGGPLRHGDRCGGGGGGGRASGGGRPRAEREHDDHQGQGEDGEGRTDPEQEVLHPVRLSASAGRRLRAFSARRAGM